jgi:hypothetical protein
MKIFKKSAKNRGKKSVKSTYFSKNAKRAKIAVFAIF